MPSHVVPNIMLEPERWQRDQLETRFHMAKQAYNRTLDEWLKRRRRYFQSDAFREAETREAYIDAMRAVGFEGPDGNEQIRNDDKLDLFGKPSGDGWCSDMAYHLPSEMLRRIGGMAAQAVMHFHREDDYGKPRPKAEPPPLATSTGIKMREDEATLRIAGPRGGADPLVIDVNERYLDQPKIRRSLENRKTYAKVMVCREMIGGRPEYKAKVTCKGRAPLSADTTARDGVVGVDVGPSKVAAVSDAGAWFGPILDRRFIDEYANELRRLGRRLDRQRRANNPERFDDRGRVVGAGPWVVSARQERTYAEHDEAFRVMLEERKRQHYELAKRLLELGNRFVVEDNAYRGWQAGLFGAAVGDFAPATFIDRLEEKAEAAGGSVRKVSTWSTKLSSRCHCGREHSKSLSERRHECPCGVSAQRDLYSAFLARHIDVAEGELDTDQAADAWSTLEPALQSVSGEPEVAKPDFEKVPA